MTFFKPLSEFADKDEKKCYDCNEWFGRCGKGKINKIAKDPACRDFEPKPSIEADIDIQRSRTCGVVLSSTLPKGGFTIG